MTWTLSAFSDEAGGSCEEQILGCQRNDLKFLDLRSVDGHNVSTLPLDHARTVKAKLDDAGLQVQMLGSPIGKIDITDDFEIDLEKLRHLADLAPVLGCNWVRFFSYYNKKHHPRDEWRRESLGRLEKLQAAAARLDLVLFHENERHIFGDELEQVLEIAQLRDEHLKLIFDFDNFNQSGMDVWQCWQQLADATDAFHLKDSARTAGGEHQHVPLGQGDGQVQRILADAAARGWSGPLSIEPHLVHSGAVASTNVSGTENPIYKEMPPAESFHIACRAARQLLEEVGAPIV